jgi:hypothetical protein
MSATVSRSIQLRLKLLEAEHEIRQMESDVDYSKEQTLLIREAIKEKQDSIDGLRLRVDRSRQREEHSHESV